MGRRRARRAPNNMISRRVRPKLLFKLNHIFIMNVQTFLLQRVMQFTEQILHVWLIDAACVEVRVMLVHAVAYEQPLSNNPRASQHAI